MGRYNEAIETYNLAFSKDFDSADANVRSLNRSKSLGRNISPTRRFSVQYTAQKMKDVRFKSPLSDRTLVI